jgi:V-type H+-transporting ATPase subunit a
MNEFVFPYHEIVVTYGTPNYKEINPTTFNLVTFPFLFGIMFGDIGHGSLLFFFSIYLCWNNESLKNSSLRVLLKIRYLMLSMGFFATYCGFIYNDMMSMPLNLFGSCYTNVESTASTEEHSHGTAVVRAPDCIYPFGFDPKWYLSSAEISFFNSFKMKFAVIIGVAQMALGVILKGLNSIHHKSGVEFFFEFIPQFIFLVALFGFMDLMIILKWLTDWKGKEGMAPSIITQMINIAIKGGEVAGDPLVGDEST